MSRVVIWEWFSVLLLVLLWQTSLAENKNVFGSDKSLHRSLFTLDTHIDTPIRLALPGFEIGVSYDYRDYYSAVDITRLAEGGLDGGFWAIYSPQGLLNKAGFEISYINAKRRLSQIITMVSNHPGHFRLARSVSEVFEMAEDGRHVVVMSMENAYPIGEDLHRLEEFYQSGVRMLGLVHTRNNQFADSSTDRAGPRWGGLSPLGAQLVLKANRLGMILDASHASDQVLEQLLEISRAPVVLSHSGAKSVFEHPRNVGDRLLKKLARSGGVISMNTYGTYLKALKVDSRRLDERQALVQQMYDAEDLGEPMLFERFSEGFLSIDKKYTPERASIDEYMRHFLYALELLGPEHVGVGADWDGGGGVVGLEDVSMINKITTILTEKGYSESELSNIWSGNVLRVFHKVEAVAADLRAKS